MRILIMDRDRLATQLVSSKLVEAGHEVVVEPSRQDALDKIKEEHFDVVMIDPSPLPSARPIILAIKRMNLKHYIYLMLMTHNANIDDVIRSGLNDYIAKPLDSSDLKVKIQNAQNIIHLDRTLQDQSKDIRTDGDVFGKRPFIHLFMAALDRANRYREQAFLLFFTITNYDHIKKSSGEEEARRHTDHFASYLAGLRRQSDFLSRIDDHEFVLLMQRPNLANEPVEAANRYHLALKEYEARNPETPEMPHFYIRLVELPMGNTITAYQVPESH